MKESQLWVAVVGFVLVQAGSRQKALARETEESRDWQGGENETKSITPLIFKQTRQETYPGLDTNRLQRKGEGEKDMNVFVAIRTTQKTPNQPEIYTHRE